MMANISGDNQRQENMDDDHGYMTLAEFCRREGVASRKKFVKRLGKIVAKVCRTLDVCIGTVTGEHQGTIRSYPVGMLEVCYIVMREMNQTAWRRT